MSQRLLIASLLSFCILSSKIYANCLIISDQPTAKISDGLSLLLASDSKCPTDVSAFRKLLKKSGLTLETTMVANRGFHNPSAGSFSLFEIVSGQLILKSNLLTISNGDFFFGHFTTIDSQDNLVNDQTPEKGALMIEAFAWDAQKEAFNFYELRGDGTQGQWFYRGDSFDIFADNTFLHRQPNPKQPQFGNRLRCSACHDAGGPIMKELSPPHNDWWLAERKLDLGGRKADIVLQEMLDNLVPATHLAN